MGCGASVPVINSIDPHHSKSPLPPPIASNGTNNETTIVKPNHLPTSNELVQNFLLVWLDEKLNENTNDFRNSLQRLRNVVNVVKIFQDTNQCIKYIKTLETEKAFLIVSGRLCHTVVPNVHEIDQIYSIYIFCEKRSKYVEWAKDWPKVKDVVTDVSLICDSLRKSARECDEDSVTIDSISSLTDIELSFIYTLLLKEIILEINFNDEQEVKALAEYARQKYSDNDGELALIDEFRQKYPCVSEKNNKPIWWYSRECFIYHMLNKALGTLQVETLLKMGIFFRDLHQNI